MKKIIKTLEWKFDYYVAWMFYNGKKMNRYVDYMCNKYPGKFEKCLEEKTKDIYN